MKNVNQRQMERLFSIEISLTNVYQELMTLEKEGGKNTGEYKEGIEKLKCIKTVEMPLVEELYEQYELDQILSFFEDVSMLDTLYSVLKFQNVFALKSRIVQLFLEYSYQGMETLKSREEKVLFDEKCEYIADILFLNHGHKMIQKQIENQFYKESFITLKYNAIYTYPSLERYLFHEKIDLVSLSFLYHINLRKTERQVRRLCEEETSSVVLRLNELLDEEVSQNIGNPFDTEMLLLTLNAYLRNVSALTFEHFYYQFKNLEVEASLETETQFKREALRKVMNVFQEILDEEKFKEQEKKKQYVKRDYLLPIEFYK